MTETRHYHESSMVVTSGPFSGDLVRAVGALCPDGTRRTAYPSTDGIADTFFSIPARVRITRNGARFTVAGYVTVETVDGYSVGTDDDPATVKFLPYLYRKNGHLLAGDMALIDYVRRNPDDGTVPYYDEAWSEMTRRGYYLVIEKRAPHGRMIYTTKGPNAGQIVKKDNPYGEDYFA